MLFSTETELDTSLDLTAASNYNQRGRAAAEYIKHGWSPIPVKFMGEEPIPSDWQDLRIGVGDIDRSFPVNEPTNIGIILGRPSNDLVIVNIVDKDALPIRGVYLPRTLVFGRTSRRRSHWVYSIQAEYTCDLAKPCKFGAGGCTIVEVCSDGQYAVFLFIRNLFRDTRPYGRELVEGVDERCKVPERACFFDRCTSTR